MRAIAYKEMFLNERSHAWFVASRNLMYQYFRKNLKNHALILDCGCGTGGTINFLNEKEESWKIYGIDVSNLALTYCKKRGINSVSIGSVNKIPYASNTFDAVICMDVLYHKGVNERLAIKEFSRVLKKGGILYLQEPAHQLLYSNHDKAIMTKKRFSKREIFDLVSKELKVNKLSYFNMIFFPFVALKRILIKNNNAHGSDVNKLPKLINFLLLVTLNFESFIIKHSHLPIGLTIVCWAKK